MRGQERRKAILELLESDGCLSINALADRFKVSKMTIHRDLALLEERNLLRRIFGGAVPVAGRSARTATDALPAVPSAGGNERRSDRHDCLICFRPAPQHLLYSLTLASGEQRFACCPHCGLSAHLLLGEQVRMSLTADYLTGKPHPAPKSFFLMGSAAAPCCHPSILTFESEEMARRFQTGFGGRLGRLNDALAYLQSEMAGAESAGPCPHCAQGNSATETSPAPG